MLATNVSQIILGESARTLRTNDCSPMKDRTMHSVLIVRPLLGSVETIECEAVELKLVA